MRKTILLLALSLPLNGSQFLFGLVPFRAELSDLARYAVACAASYCAASAPELPADMKDAVGEPVESPRGESPRMAFIPGRAFLVFPVSAPEKK